MDWGAFDTEPQAFDAVLLASFGGPAGPDDVIPFLRNVADGRQIPEGRLAAVAGRYQRFGGVSPINAANRDLSVRLEAALAGVGLDIPVRVANMHWRPSFAEVLANMADDGVRDAAVVVTNGFASYPSCRRYREQLAQAVARVGGAASGVDRAGIGLHKIRLWFDHPVFLDIVADCAVAAVSAVLDRCVDPTVLFSTHSLPLALASASGPASGARADAEGGYVAQHRFAAGAVAERVSARVGRSLAWEVVYQSRSGPSQASWLGPDINDRIAGLASEGSAGVVVVPIGFATDNMEISWDLDVNARQTADAHGLAFARAATVGADERFARLLAGLVAERSAGTPPPQRPSEGPWGPWPDLCSTDCCVGTDTGRSAICEAPVSAWAGPAATHPETGGAL